LAVDRVVDARARHFGRRVVQSALLEQVAHHWDRRGHDGAGGLDEAP
jgi:hypothetical protein